VGALILRLAYEIEQIQRDRLKGFKPAQSHQAAQKVMSSPSIHKVSVLIWNREKKFDKFTLDPNYLVRSQLKDSPFHHSLHRFIETQSGIINCKEKYPSKLIQVFSPLQATTPLFHLDLHGKKDRKHNMDIDIGTKALREDFS
jgi:hypothetical protein